MVRGVKSPLNCELLEASYLVFVYLEIELYLSPNVAPNASTSSPLTPAEILEPSEAFLMIYFDVPIPLM